MQRIGYLDAVYVFKFDFKAVVIALEWEEYSTASPNESIGASVLDIGKDFVQSSSLPSIE